MISETMSTTFNMFDLIFIFSAIIFLVVAFFRGFIKEIFALINWILTILAVYFISPYLADLINHYSGNMAVSNIIASTIIFIAIFILLALSTKKLSSAVKEKMSSTIDQSLGVVYGILKVFLVFGLVYALTINIYDLVLNKPTKSKKDSMPTWLYQARVRPYIEPFGRFLDPLVKFAVIEAKDKYVNGGEKKEEALDEKIEEVVEDEKTDKPSLKKTDKTLKDKDAKKTDEKYEEKGYSKKEIEKMNRLIEIVE